MPNFNRFLLVILIALPSITFSQSYFANKTEVVEYFAGKWNLDSLYNGWGSTLSVPDPYYFDSTKVEFEFIKTDDENFPLLCKSYRDGSLYSESMIEVEFEDKGMFTGLWVIKNIQEYLFAHIAIMEEEFWPNQGPTENKIGLVVLGFDTPYYYLSRDLTSNLSEPAGCEIKVYPNPIIDELLCINLGHDEKLAEIHIYDSTGRLLLKNSKPTPGECIDISNYPAGIYSLMANTSCQKNIVQKVVKLN